MKPAALALLVANVVASAEGAAHVVVVGGLGGEPAYEERFAAQARELAELGRALAGDGGGVRALSGPSATRAALREALNDIARSSAAADVLIVMAVGHGSVDGTEYKLNLAGPDPTCTELDGWLDAVPARRQLVVLATSASGACLQPLAREGRAILSATRSGAERNAPVFARYFVEALRDPAADRDHDETTTAREAFLYAQQKVQRFYADGKRLATEHSVLSGDSAAHIVLARRGAAARTASGAPELLARRSALEDEVRAVKSRKAELAREQYLSELERVLLELARVQESLDGGGSGRP